MKVSIVILSYNNKRYLEELIHSLEGTITKDCEIVIVDNGSERETREYLEGFQKKRQKHRVVFLDENKGYSAGNNIGADAARGKYLIFLNNDMVARRGWLQPLLQELGKRSVGIVGAKLLFLDKRIQHAGLTAFFNMYPLSRKYRVPDKRDNEKGPVEVLAVTGACLGIKKDLFHAMGGFDERFHLVFQDMDLCYKVLKEGRNIVYRPDAKLIHYESLTLNTMRKQKIIDEDWRFLKRKWSRQFKELIGINIKHMKKDLKDAKLIVYGTGLLSSMISRSLKKSGIKILGYTEPDMQKCKKKFKGSKSILLEEVNEINNAKLLIASLFQYEIKQKLKKARIKVPVINAVTHVKDVYRIFRN